MLFPCKENAFLVSKDFWLPEQKAVAFHVTHYLLQSALRSNNAK